LWAKLVILGVAALWGTNFGSVKLLQDAVGSTSAAAALRFSLAGVAMLPALRNVPRGLWLDASVTGLFVFLGYFTQSISLNLTEANTSAFLCALSVILTPLITSAARKTLPGLGIGSASDEGPNWTAAILALTGVAMLEISPATSAFGLGDVWGIAQAFMFACGFILNGRTMRKYPGSALQLAAIQINIIALGSLAWYAADATVGGSAVPDMSQLITSLSDTQTLLAVLFTGLITTAGCIAVETVALKEVHASEMAVLLATEPVWAALFSSVVLGERMGWQGWLGGAIVMAGCLQSQSGSLKEYFAKRFGRKSS